MYFLRVRCSAEDSEIVSAELWQAGTAGIQELDYGPETVLLAGFENNDQRAELLRRFEQYSPEWEHEAETDWVQFTRDAWPPRDVGTRIFLAPPWCDEATPAGRVRVVHNPGIACGTGEHPCTQLALCAIEKHLRPGDRMADIGAGSGMLALAALHLGARAVAALDLDCAALTGARENFALNGFPAPLAAGSAECLASGSFDLTVANISGTVLLDIFQDLLRITAAKGRLILTGFQDVETSLFQKLLPDASVTSFAEWRCVVAAVPAQRERFGVR